MSRTIAPLLSFGASGQIAKTQVYSTWKGIPYVRRYAIPANPRTADQTEVRSVFSYLNDVWKFAPTLMVEAYDAYASGQPLTGRNGLIKQNLAALQTATDVADFVFSPGAKSGIALAGLSLTPGTDKITVDAVAPDLPNGWTLTAVVAAALANEDPHTTTMFIISAAQDASAPYSFDITGLETGQEYVVGAWAKFTRPDGSFAYGRSINDTATPT